MPHSRDVHVVSLEGARALIAECADTADRIGRMLSAMPLDARGVATLREALDGLEALRDDCERGLR